MAKVKTAKRSARVRTGGRDWSEDPPEVVEPRASGRRLRPDDFMEFGGDEDSGDLSGIVGRRSGEWD
ncbi:MAG: hypothetical protein JWN37_125 [Candidatus Nomurabacteria bacterium]|nr:hypothetical protein [Candidatus Nomurabacteria bacterium]